MNRGQLTRFNRHSRRAFARMGSFQAVLLAEIKLRLRDTSVPLLLGAAAGTCILLTPPENAGYAVVTFGGLKPILSVGTSLIAAAIVFSLLVFPAYLLGLGMGYARDRRLDTGVLLASSPVSPEIVIAGRLLANAILVTLFSTVVLLLVTAVLFSRFGSFPPSAALLTYFLIVVPAGVCSLPAAALIDRYLSDRDFAKAAVAIGFWIALLISSLLVWPDVFGFLFLRQNHPVLASVAQAGSSSDISVGIIVAKQMPTIRWATAELTAAFAAARLWLLLGAVSIAAVLAFSTGRGLKAAFAQPVRCVSASSIVPRALPTANLSRWQPVTTTPFRAALAMLRRWLAGATWSWLLLAAAVLASICLPASSRVPYGTALLIPLTVVSSRRIRGERSIRSSELSTSGLWRPSPALFTAITLAVLTALPLCPALLTFPPLRAIHVVIAITGSALWLTWTCAGIDRPLLGISIYTLAWYLSTFCDVPPAADLLGIAGTSLASLVVSASLAVLCGFLLFRTDVYEYKSTHRI